MSVLSTDNISMPLWMNLDDEWWEQFEHPLDDSHAEWVHEILDEIIAEEGDDEYPPF